MITAWLPSPSIVKRHREDAVCGYERKAPKQVVAGSVCLPGPADVPRYLTRRVFSWHAALWRSARAGGVALQIHRRERLLRHVADEGDGGGSAEHAERHDTAGKLDAPLQCRPSDRAGCDVHRLRALRRGPR